MTPQALLNKVEGSEDRIPDYIMALPASQLSRPYTPWLGRGHPLRETRRISEARLSTSDILVIL